MCAHIHKECSKCESKFSITDNFIYFSGSKWYCETCTRWKIRNGELKI